MIFIWVLCMRATFPEELINKEVIIHPATNKAVILSYNKGNKTFEFKEEVNNQKDQIVNLIYPIDGVKENNYINITINGEKMCIDKITSKLKSCNLNDSISDSLWRIKQKSDGFTIRQPDVEFRRLNWYYKCITYNENIPSKLELSECKRNNPNQKFDIELYDRKPVDGNEKYEKILIFNNKGKEEELFVNNSLK